jgi:hypothetical protein
VVTAAKHSDLGSPFLQEEVGAMIEHNCLGEIGFKHAEIRKAGCLSFRVRVVDEALSPIRRDPH